MERYAANLLVHETNPTSQTVFRSDEMFDNFDDFMNHYQRKQMK